MRAICPTIKTYSKAELARLKIEFDALPADSEIRKVIGDDHALRAQVRACRK